MDGMALIKCMGLIVDEYCCTGTNHIIQVDHAAPGNMPVGEAVDGVTGTFVMSSCPGTSHFSLGS